MAQFCTKCGAPLAEGMKFCTGCGATMGGPPAPAPAPSAPVAQPPVVATPITPAMPVTTSAPSSGSSVLKIVLIVLAVLIFLGLLSAGACVYFVYRTKQRISQFEKQVHTTFPTPTGTREVHPEPSAPTPAPSPQATPVVDTTVPVYPGASAGGGQSQLSLGVAGIKVQQYTTSDSVEKVLTFYKEKFGPSAMITESGGQASVQLAGSNGMITVAIAPDSGSGKTKITISSITK